MQGGGQQIGPPPPPGGGGPAKHEADATRIKKPKSFDVNFITLKNYYDGINVIIFTCTNNCIVKTSAIYYI